jgi:hypothetical protein
MHHGLPVRKHFDISALSEPQLELRLHWFGRALAVRRGYIVDVQRRRSGAGEHVASIAYELPLPHYPRRPRARRSQRSLVVRPAGTPETCDI